MAGNANSGRRPKPRGLHEINGNPSRKALGDEPTPPAGLVAPPPGVTAAGRLVWDELAPVVLAMHTLTTADVHAFASLCELEAVRRVAAEAREKLSTSALFRKGRPHASIRLERETAQALRPFLDYFGLTPTSRARLGKAPSGTPKREPSPLAKLLIASAGGRG